MLRGVGKGIAIALGQTGATVYVTGRSINGTESPVGGTIAETAAAVTKAGGRGIAVAVDHTDDAAVAALFAQIANEHGRLDILVNNAARIVGTRAPSPFWQKPLERADLLLVGLRSHFVASYFAAPLLIANGRGLIVNTGHYGAVSYYQGPIYGAQKAGADKMAADMAKELRPYDVTAVSIWMGNVDIERSRSYYATASQKVRNRLRLESPQFTGRVIAALYASEERMPLPGQALIGAELAKRLGVLDIDGRQAPSHRRTLGAPHQLHKTLRPLAAVTLSIWSACLR